MCRRQKQHTDCGHMQSVSTCSSHWTMCADACLCRGFRDMVATLLRQLCVSQFDLFSLVVSACSAADHLPRAMMNPRTAFLHVVLLLRSLALPSLATGAPLICPLMLFAYASIGRFGDWCILHASFHLAKECSCDNGRVCDDESVCEDGHAHVHGILR